MSQWKIDQGKKDCEFLLEALSAGPQRYAQMTSGIYEIYERWDIDCNKVSPQGAITMIASLIEPRRCEGCDGKIDEDGSETLCHLCSEYSGVCFFCSKDGCNNECMEGQAE